MKRKTCRSGVGNYERPGFTLVETVTVLTIIGLLIAIVLAALGPAREQARRTTCLSNLHQIGVAIAMYRHDNDGGDVTGGAQTATSLGLPLNSMLVEPYLKDRQVFKCPNHNMQIMGTSYSSYSWGIWEENDIPGDPWSHWIQKRGERLPILLCINHDPEVNLRILRDKPYFVQLLRLDNSVQGAIGKDASDF